MKFNFFKTKKNISLASLYDKQISPKRDWLVIVFVASAFILSVAIMSSVLFISVLNTDASDLNLNYPNTSGSIDENKLNSAIELINGRLGGVLVPPAGIGPASKP